MKLLLIFGHMFLYHIIAINYQGKKVYVKYHSRIKVQQKYQKYNYNNYSQVN